MTFIVPRQLTMRPLSSDRNACSGRLAKLADPIGGSGGGDVRQDDNLNCPQLSENLQLVSILRNKLVYNHPQLSYVVRVILWKRLLMER